MNTTTILIAIAFSSAPMQPPTVTQLGTFDDGLACLYASITVKQRIEEGATGIVARSDAPRVTTMELQCVPAAVPAACAASPGACLQSIVPAVTVTSPQ